MRKEVRGEMKRKESSFGKPFLSKRFVEVAIVLCLLFFVALPATTLAAEDDYVLGVYGNANEDDTIDMRDLTYVKLIFFGKKPETELADAKCDGKINPLDFIQIKLIIVGKEKELTVVDGRGKDVTVKKPVKRIIPLSINHADAFKVLGAENNVVGVGPYVAAGKRHFPVMSKLPMIGSCFNPDCEAILNLKPDIVTTYVKYPKPEQLEEKLEPYVTVARFDLSDPETLVKGMKKLGYIINKRTEAEEFIDWYEDHINMIKDRTKGLLEEDKPHVYLELYPEYKKYYTMGKDSSGDLQCRIAGGINIAGDVHSGDVDPEWVAEQNPDVVIMVVTGEPTFSSGYEVDDITEVKAIREQFMNRPELQNTNAVKNNQVYVVAEGLRCSIQQIISIAYMAKWFHPKLFMDIDPKTIHQEYLDRFQRIDYDLDEHGVFVYPEPS